MDPIVSTVVSDHSANLVAILYHPRFPNPADPFYRHSPTPNDDRVDYYSVFGTPKLLFDGLVPVGYPYNYDNIVSQYETRLPVASPVSLAITGSYSPDRADAQVHVTASAETALPAGDYRLHIVLTESGIPFDGSGFHDIHDHTMRAMYPDAAGTPVVFGVDNPDQASASAILTLDPLYILENCSIVCFLQENGSREILQAASIALTELPPSTATATLSWSEIKAAFSETR